MKLYEIYSPELDTNIRFKVLSALEVKDIVQEYAHAEHEIFMRAVLEAVIYNLKTDVTTAIKKVDKETAKNALNSLFTGCLMLHPGLDVDSWMQICNAPNLLASNFSDVPPKRMGRKMSTASKIKLAKKIPRSKMLNLERFLQERVIGQEEAIKELSASIKRSHVGLGDENRPRGVFLFAGASGVGKTLLAKELHDFLYGNAASMVRIDCGEYQHKHENSKLLGAPPGYLGYDSGSFLSNELLDNPNTVILLDEVEKAHPDLWNTFLRVFDEGWLTDAQGRKIPFHNATIIMTTNLGNRSTVDELLNQGMGFNRYDNALPSREKIMRTTTEAINKYFPPEFRNRIDKTIVFNHLTNEDHYKIAELELKLIQSKLEKRGYVLTFDNTVLEAMIRDGVNHVQGARGLSQLRRDRIENLLADTLLEHTYPKGVAFKLSFDAGSFQVTAEPPVINKRTLKRSAPTQQESAPTLAL